MYSQILPFQHKSELQTELSGETFQERMIADDDEIERKSLDYGAFVRLAPCYKTNESGSGSGIMY
ncbi:hypothetical protein ACHAXR_010461 [Thalassiosira sp. AJA248-18]